MTVGFTSCEKVIEFNGDITDPYLVVISKPVADSTWMLRVSESRFFLSNADVPYLDNVQVIAAVNGNESVAVSEGEGMYNTGIVPHPGDSLSLRVISPALGEVSAGCRIPQQPVVSDFSIEYDTTMYEYSWRDGNDSLWVNRYIEGDILLHFKLHDPGDEQNYYMVRMVTYDIDSRWFYHYIYINDEMLFDIDATNEVFDMNDNEENHGTTLSFSDQRINGKVHPVTISFPYYSYYSDVDQDFENRHTRLEVYSISRDLYLFEKTIKAANNQNDFTQIISEPVQVHTNIRGGIGILGASSKVSFNVFE